MAGPLERSKRNRFAPDPAAVIVTDRVKAD
jgi:hypothetical protein